mmetsp:Transcript_12944/g.23490  ORF Transcript_12944/g.23490 Transcript_12944/m.23490 type:complete len:341 (+) Transcript_12944:632-1654(+)
MRVSSSLTAIADASDASACERALPSSNSSCLSILFASLSLDSAALAASRSRERSSYAPWSWLRSVSAFSLSVWTCCSRLDFSVARLSEADFKSFLSFSSMLTVDLRADSASLLVFSLSAIWSSVDLSALLVWSSASEICLISALYLDVSSALLFVCASRDACSCCSSPDMASFRARSFSSSLENSTFVLSRVASVVLSVFVVALSSSLVFPRLATVSASSDLTPLRALSVSESSDLVSESDVSVVDSTRCVSCRLLVVLPSSVLSASILPSNAATASECFLAASSDACVRAAWSAFHLSSCALRSAAWAVSESARFCSAASSFAALASALLLASWRASSS